MPMALLKQCFSPRCAGYLVLGSLIYSIGFNIFILPCNLYTGGFLGITQLLCAFLEWLGGIFSESSGYTGIMYFLINIPLVLMAYKVFGHVFILKSIFGVGLYSLFLSIIPIPDHNYLPDMVSACVAGGVLCGIGIALTLLSKGSGGGEEILGLLMMQKYRNMTVGKLTNIINIFVFAICAYVYSVSVAVYSAFFAVVTAVVLDKVHFPSITVTMLIISKKDGIENIVFENVHRGVTRIKGVGAYSGEETNILLTVLSKAEANNVRRKLAEYDENVFIIEDENVSVLGNFQRRL